jgi:hypothetical protein
MTQPTTTFVATHVTITRKLGAFLDSIMVILHGALWRNLVLLGWCRLRALYHVVRVTSLSKPQSHLKLVLYVEHFSAYWSLLLIYFFMIEAKTMFGPKLGADFCIKIGMPCHCHMWIDFLCDVQLIGKQPAVRQSFRQHYILHILYCRQRKNRIHLYVSDRRACIA